MGFLGVRYVLWVLGRRGGVIVYVFVCDIERRREYLLVFKLLLVILGKFGDVADVLGIVKFFVIR